MSGLSPRQAQLLRVIGGYLRLHGFPPTLEQMRMSLALDTTSRNVVNLALNEMERKGYLKRSFGVARGIRLTQEGQAWLQEEEEWV